MDCKYIMYCPRICVEGKKLSEVLQQREKIPRELDLRLFLQLVDAFAYLSSCRIAHRDVCAENVMVREVSGICVPFDGEALQFQFGRDSCRTRAASLEGLGCILFEVVTHLRLANLPSSLCTP